MREIVRVTKDKFAESECEKSPESPSQPMSVQTETAASAPEPEVAESPEAHPATERSGTDENPEARIEARPTWLERRDSIDDLLPTAESTGLDDTEAESASEFVADESILGDLGAALERQRELTPEEILQDLTDDELAAERGSLRRH